MLPFQSRNVRHSEEELSTDDVEVVQHAKCGSRSPVEQPGEQQIRNDASFDRRGLRTRSFFAPRCPERSSANPRADSRIDARACAPGSRFVRRVRRRDDLPDAVEADSSAGFETKRDALDVVSPAAASAIAPRGAGSYAAYAATDARDDGSPRVDDLAGRFDDSSSHSRGARLARADGDAVGRQ